MKKDAAFIKELAKHAGEIHLEHINTRGVYKKEGVSNYVTDADYASEKYIIETVKKHFPEDVFISEETENIGFEEKAKGSFWVIDPLDGTNNFTFKRNYSVASVAYGEAGEILMGAIYNPFSQELYFAEKGKGSFCNTQQLRLPEREKGYHFTVGTGPSNNPEESKKNLETLLAISPTPHFRAYGAAAQEIAWIATGKLDVYLHYHLNPWDIAAAYLIVMEAGGYATDFQGKPSTFLTPDIIIGHKEFVTNINSQL